MDRHKRGRPKKLPKIDRYCTQPVKENETIYSGLMQSSSQDEDGGIAQVSWKTCSSSEVFSDCFQKSTEIGNGKMSKNIWNVDMDDSFMDFRSPVNKKRKVQLKLPFSNKQDNKKSERIEGEVKCSLASDSVAAVELCNAECSSSSAESKGFTKAIDEKTGSESTSADEGQQKNTSLCPVCWKRFDKVNIVHLKSCAAQHNMTTLQLMNAMALQEKQTAEREALGLPAIPHTNKKPSIRKQGSVASDSNDPNLQLALALSASMQDAEEQQILEQDEILIEAGLGQEVVAKQMNLLERFGFTSSRPALLTASNSRPRAKHKLKGFPTLLLRTEEDRNRLITEKVALILMSEESIPDDENQTPSVKYPLKSEFLQQYLSEDCYLWTKASASPSRFEKSEYYVGDLSAFISPSKVEAGSKLRHLSQVPCRIKTPSKGFPFTTESPDKLPENTYEPEFKKSENLTPSITQPLQMRVGHSPMETGSEERNPSSSPQQTSNMKSEWKQSTESNTQSDRKKTTGSIHFVENLASDWRSILNKTNMSDITIYVKNRLKIPAHELVFYVRCPAILMDVVQGDRSGKSILWTDISYRSALAFLEYLYCGNASKILSLSEGLEDVMWLTEKYEVVSLEKFLKVLTNVRGKVTQSRQTSPWVEIGSKHSDNATAIEVETNHFQRMRTPRKHHNVQGDQMAKMSLGEWSRKSIRNYLEINNETHLKMDNVGLKSPSPENQNYSLGLSNQGDMEDEKEHSQSMLSPRYKSPRKHYKRNQTSKISSRNDSTNSPEDYDCLNIEEASPRSLTPDPFAESQDKSLGISTQDNMNCLLELLDTSSPVQSQHKDSPKQDIDRATQLNVKERSSESRSSGSPSLKSCSERIVIHSSQSSSASDTFTGNNKSPVINSRRRIEKLSALVDSPSEHANKISQKILDKDRRNESSPNKLLVDSHSHVRKSLLKSFISENDDQQEIMTYDLTQASDDTDNKEGLSPGSHSQTDVVQCDPKPRDEFPSNKKQVSLSPEEMKNNRCTSESEDISRSDCKNENLLDVQELSSDDETNISQKFSQRTKSKLTPSNLSDKPKMSKKLFCDNEKEFLVSPNKLRKSQKPPDDGREEPVHESKDIDVKTEHGNENLLEVQVLSSDDEADTSPKFLKEFCESPRKSIMSQKSSNDYRKESIESPSKIRLSQKLSGYHKKDPSESPGKNKLPDSHKNELLQSPSKNTLTLKSSCGHREKHLESPSRPRSSQKPPGNYRKENFESPSKIGLIQGSPNDSRTEYLESPSKISLSQKLSTDRKTERFDSPNKITPSRDLSDENKRKCFITDSPDEKSDIIPKKPRKETGKNSLASVFPESEPLQENEEVVVFDLTQASDSNDQKMISSPLNLSEASTVEYEKAKNKISPLRNYAVSPKRRITNKLSPGRGISRMHDESLNKIKALIADDMSPKSDCGSRLNQNMNSTVETDLYNCNVDENLKNNDGIDCHSEPPQENSIDFCVNEVDFFDYNCSPVHAYILDPAFTPESKNVGIKDERLSSSQKFSMSPSIKTSPMWKKVLSQDSALKDKSVEVIELDDSIDDHPRHLGRCNSDSELSKKRNSLDACKRLLEDSFVDQLGELSWKDELDTADAVAYSTPKALKTPVQRVKTTKSCEVTPLADYSAMNTPMLKKELHKYGIKPLKKKQAKIILRHIYNELHPVVEEISTNPERTSPFKEPGADTVVPRSPVKRSLAKQITSPAKKGTKKAASQPLPDDSDSEDTSSLSSSQSSSMSSTRSDLLAVDDLQDEPGLTQKDSANLPDVVRNHILSDPELHEKVLLYEPIWLEKLHEDLKAMKYKFKLEQLMHYLDGQCITFRTSQQQKTNARRNARKKNSPKKKSPAKRSAASKCSQKEGTTKVKAPRKKKVSASSSQSSSDPLSR